MFEVGQKVELEQVLNAGFTIDSYSKSDNTVSYVSNDGTLNVLFKLGDDYGIVGINH